MVGTGAGLESWEMPDFHTHIRDNVCRYYFELLPVLKDRPNVLPWFTNGKDNLQREDSSDDCNESIDDDNESIVEVEELENEVEYTGTKRNNVAVSSNQSLYHNDSSKNEPPISSTISFRTYNNSPNVSSVSNDVNTQSQVSYNHKASSKSSDTTSYASTSNNNKNKISPVRAKSIQKNMFKDKKRQISSSNNKKSKTSNWHTSQKDHHDFLIESRDSKMSFEVEKYRYLQKVDNKKMELEETKIKLCAEESNYKQEQIKLERDRLNLDKELIEKKKAQIQIQTDLQRADLMLKNVELYKARLDLKKKDPTITEEMLNTLLPLFET
jgi:hypothetical protein